MVPTSFFLCFGATMHEPFYMLKKEKPAITRLQATRILAQQDYIHMTHQQPCGTEPGGSNWLLLKSALVEYHVFAASKRKRRYSRNIFFATA